MQSRVLPEKASWRILFFHKMSLPIVDRCMLDETGRMTRANATGSKQRMLSFSDSPWKNGRHGCHGSRLGVCCTWRANVCRVSSRASSTAQLRCTRLVSFSALLCVGRGSGDEVLKMIPDDASFSSRENLLRHHRDITKRRTRKRSRNVPRKILSLPVPPGQLAKG